MNEAELIAIEARAEAETLHALDVPNLIAEIRRIRRVLMARYNGSALMREVFGEEKTADGGG